MSDDPVPIQAFLDDERASLERFSAMWIKSAASNPDEFPTLLPMGEWWEQFMAFASTEDGE